MEQDGKQTSKRSDRKSEEVRKASRVVDMSWAADYLDDTWENEHAAKGAYDTQVIPPLKKYMPADTAGVNPLSTTQEFKVVPGTAAHGSVLSNGGPHMLDARADQDEETSDNMKIRDALTDQTVASMEEARAVRRAAAFFDLREELDERPAIRDALSGAPTEEQSGASGSDNMDKVREALASAPRMPAFLNRTGAASPKPVTSRSHTNTASPKPAASAPRTSTPSPKPAASASRMNTASPKPAASAPGVKTGNPKVISAGTAQERKAAPVLETQEEQAKTIVASKDVADVRKAASGAVVSRNQVKELFRNDDAGLEPDDDDRNDQYEDILDYDEDLDRYDDGGDFDDRDAFDDYDDDPDPDELDDPDAYRESDRYYEPDDDYDDRRARRRRRPDKYYYGYKEPRNPLRFIPLVLVVAICVLGFIVAMQICHDVPLNASDYSKVKYTVEAGLTDEQLSQDLQALGIIDNPLVFRLRCKFYDADYVPGTYELSPCYSTEKIINILSGYTYGTDE